MAAYEVVPYRFYRHTSGRAASIHGALPWWNEIEKQQWTEVEQGYTVYNPLTNQYGIGRKPWETREEAQTWADTHRPSHISIGD
jgi:hypothetical protein